MPTRTRVSTMLDLTITDHALQRMNQRGYRKRDVDVVLRYGTTIRDAVVFLSRKDAERAILDAKEEIRALERLKGTKLVVETDSIVTLYRPSRRRVKRMFRHKN